MNKKYILFRVNDKFIALKIILVREVLLHREIDDLPISTKNVKGVFNLRGQIIPVIDLPKILGLKKSEVERPNIIVLESAEDTNDFGFEVDEVIEVVNVGDELISSSNESLGAFGKYTSGIITELTGHDEKIIYILDESIVKRKHSKVEKVA